MPGLRTRFIVTEETESPLHYEKIDAALLRDYVTPGRDTCYICGPDAMLDDMVTELTSLDMAEADIVTEEFD
ncbi:flavodoxin reductase, partial [Salipiger sp. HF18]|nr:flavodoxin reductase [Salipiger sp. HF18]